MMNELPGNPENRIGIRRRETEMQAENNDSERWRGKTIDTMTLFVG